MTPVCATRIAKDNIALAEAKCRFYPFAVLDGIGDGKGGLWRLMMAD